MFQSANPPSFRHPLLSASRWLRAPQPKSQFVILCRHGWSSLCTISNLLIIQV
ncbi:hypothetical protein BDW71DRAFT_186895 [Aspergillus fruticulosus]